MQLSKLDFDIRHSFAHVQDTPISLRHRRAMKFLSIVRAREAEYRKSSVKKMKLRVKLREVEGCDDDVSSVKSRIGTFMDTLDIIKASI